MRLYFKGLYIIKFFSFSRKISEVFLTRTLKHFKKLTKISEN